MKQKASLPVTRKQKIYYSKQKTQLWIRRNCMTYSTEKLQLFSKKNIPPSDEASFPQLKELQRNHALTHHFAMEMLCREPPRCFRQAKAKTQQILSNRVASATKLSRIIILLKWHRKWHQMETKGSGTQLPAKVRESAIKENWLTWPGRKACLPKLRI